MDDLVCHVELRPDGVVIVRVPPSSPALAESLPDAVFSFRPGDPQYAYWRARGEFHAGIVAMSPVPDSVATTA